MIHKTTVRGGDQDNDHRRQLLLRQKAEFQEALGISSHRLAGGELDVDPVSRLQEESLNLGLNWVLYGQLRQVEEALDRLDQEEYGYCIACHEPIAPNRLRSVPWTPYCLGCQERIVPAQLPVEAATARS